MCARIIHKIIIIRIVAATIGSIFPHTLHILLASLAVSYTHLRSKLYLADGYDIVRSYVGGSEMNITEKKENKRRGIMILYALPDTKKLGLTEAPVSYTHLNVAIAS